jgi:hypothetical protein
MLEFTVSAEARHVVGFVGLCDASCLALVCFGDAVLGSAGVAVLLL